jgi:transposase
MIQGGRNVAQAARLMEIPYPTAQNIWNKYRKTGSTSNYSRSGCPTKVNNHMK